MTELAPRDADEVRSLASLAFRELGDAATGLYGFHRAIAGRAFGASGPGAIPARAVHDAISARAYRAVGGGFRLVGAIADAALGGRRVEDGRALSSSPRGALLVGALTGLIGDRLEREGSDLHQPLAARVGGRAVEPDAEGLAAAYPAATPELVVFLHGLMESEFAWRVGGRRDSYGSRLREDLGLTPVELRYNTGRHISENGLELADLLERLVAEWPVEVERIVLVGHSMGGLVARSACYQAAERGDDWVGRVRHVVSLGSPHMGAPLAQGVHWASAALHALPETRPLATLPAPPQRRHPRPAPGLAGGRRLARLRPGRAARRGLPGGAAARRRDPLLRGGDDHRRPAPPRRAPDRRLPRAREQRLGPQPHTPHPVRGRARPGGRRHAPHRAAQPPRRVRAAAGVAGGR